MSDNEPRDVDGLDETPVEDTDEREALVASALERFFGGNHEMSESEEP